MKHLILAILLVAAFLFFGLDFPKEPRQRLFFEDFLSPFSMVKELKFGY